MNIMNRKKESLTAVQTEKALPLDEDNSKMKVELTAES